MKRANLTDQRGWINTESTNFAFSIVSIYCTSNNDKTLTSLTAAVWVSCSQTNTLNAFIMAVMSGRRMSGCIRAYVFLAESKQQ